MRQWTTPDNRALAGSACHPDPGPLTTLGGVKPVYRMGAATTGTVGRVALSAECAPTRLLPLTREDVIKPTRPGGRRVALHAGLSRSRDLRGAGGRCAIKSPQTEDRVGQIRLASTLVGILYDPPSRATRRTAQPITVQGADQSRTPMTISGSAMTMPTTRRR